MKRSFLLFTTLAFLLLSCSSPLDREYSKETFEKDFEELAKSGDIDSSGLKVLTGVAMAGAFGMSTDLEGKTYREIIEEAKKKEAEEKALAEKARKEEAERIAKLSGALSVTVFEKGFEEVDYQKYITYKMVMDNKTDKEIRAVKGRVDFLDLFGEKIKSVEITSDDHIQPNSNIKPEYYTNYNQFMQEDKVLANKKLEDMKVNWVPEKIIFKDGSTLE